ncbi:alpha/beta hydrolase [uncultured Kordia sp.]|uniref:alpha/beta hydrolase n=1 Tax=uncultured Kordia sp. TaxID=507699 RepID=UPI0026129510|nr:alpha/beta hydrolase [uncultured Kordia sp.]
MRPRFIILSDLWGRQKSAWTHLYIEKLASEFDIQYYDCCQLGNVNTEIYTQDNLHQQFISFGIETAVKSLIQLEKKPAHILAFSIGGTIAWKAALLGLPLISLYAISATRLRHEINIPKKTIQLYFGINDPYKPSADWCNQFTNEKIVLLDGETHEMYQKEKIATLVCNNIIAAN